MQTSRQRAIDFGARLILHTLALTLIVSTVVVALALGGCSSMPIPGDVGSEPMHAAPTASAAVQASCPPLGPLPAARATDVAALQQRLREVEMRYADCRDAALNPTTKRRQSTLFAD